MTFLEYGNASAPTILMIHGMGMTAEGSFGYAVEQQSFDTFHTTLFFFSKPPVFIRKTGGFGICLSQAP